MNERPTPETDAAVDDTAFEDKNQVHTDWVTAFFSRKLERERDEAWAAIAGWENKWKWAVEMAALAEVERDEALSQIVKAECRAERFCQERDEAIADRDILRIDAQREAEHHDRMVSELEKVYKERDEARELNAKLFALADRATDDLRWFCESNADGISSELEKLKEAVK